MTEALPSNSTVAIVERARGEIRRQKRFQTILFVVVAAAAYLAAGYIGEVSLGTLAEGFFGVFTYIYDTAPTLHWATLGEDLASWYWGIERWLLELWKTVLIAFLGTVFGAAGAFFLCFLASANLAPNRIVAFLCRRFLELSRTVPEIVFALIFVFAFQPGPPAGVIAIAIHSMGALGKLFSEVNENIDKGPLEGLRATGSNWYEEIRFGVVPQVLPNFASYTLLRFEINIRAAAIIGIVGAGGIGQELMIAIKQFHREDQSAIVLMIILCVILIDEVGRRIRHRFIGDDMPSRG